MTPEATFEKEILPFGPALKRYAFKLTKNNEDADDLLQNTLLSAWRFRHQFQSGTSAKAWIYTIMHNRFVNDYRKVSKTPDLISIDEDYVGEYLSNKESKFTIGDDIREVMDKLSPEKRSVLILCIIQDYSYEEAGKILNIPLGTVRSKLHWAKLDMRNGLKKNLHEKMG